MLTQPQSIRKAPSLVSFSADNFWIGGWGTTLSLTCIAPCNKNRWNVNELTLLSAQFRSYWPPTPHEMLKIISEDFVGCKKYWYLNITLVKNQDIQMYSNSRETQIHKTISPFSSIWGSGYIKCMTIKSTANQVTLLHFTINII